jgi:hypothetical protein
MKESRENRDREEFPGSRHGERDDQDRTLVDKIFILTLLSFIEISQGATG